MMQEIEDHAATLNPKSHALSQVWLKMYVSRWLMADFYQRAWSI